MLMLICRLIIDRIRYMGAEGGREGRSWTASKNFLRELLWNILTGAGLACVQVYLGRRRMQMVSSVRQSAVRPGFLLLHVLPAALQPPCLPNWVFSRIFYSSQRRAKTLVGNSDITLYVRTTHGELASSRRERLVVSDITRACTLEPGDTVMAPFSRVSGCCLMRGRTLRKTRREFN